MAMQEGAMRIGTLLAGHNPEDVLAARVGGMDVIPSLVPPERGLPSMRSCNKAWSFRPCANIGRCAIFLASRP